MQVLEIIYNRVRKISSALLCGCIVLLVTGVVTGQPFPSKETQIKGVFLYNFAQFGQWPESKFETPSAPFIIGVLGPDPFGQFLDEIVRDEKTNGHPIKIERFSSAADARHCHILFIEKSKSEELPEILQSLEGQHVLTVSDMADFPVKGGMVGFFIKNNKIAFEINMTEYKSSGLILSSRLLKLAEICCE